RLRLTIASSAPSHFIFDHSRLEVNRPSWSSGRLARACEAMARDRRRLAEIDKTVPDVFL
ncbi:MAG: hypothetical protein ACJ8CH_03325, partial [Microvirga sp.]